MESWMKYRTLRQNQTIEKETTALVILWTVGWIIFDHVRLIIITLLFVQPLTHSQYLETLLFISIAKQ